MMKYKNSKRDGMGRWWYENRTIETESEYLDGELNGIYREYVEQGNLIEEQLYKYGAPINES